MNGTLLVRAKERVARDADLVHAKLHYYVRPGCLELVKALREQPGVRLAFYTSMQRRNAVPIIEHLFGAGCLSGPAAFGLYDRSYNVEDSSGANSWDTMRDLTRIWSEAGSVGHGFSELDTVMVDDTPRKMRHLPHNAVIVPEYDEAAVTRAARAGAPADGVLPALLAYLERLLPRASATGCDVRDLIRARPFRAPGGAPAPAPAPAPKAASKAAQPAAAPRAAVPPTANAPPPPPAPASAVAPEMAQFLRELAQDVQRATPKALGTLRGLRTSDPSKCLQLVMALVKKRDPARVAQFVANPAPMVAVLLDEEAPRASGAKAVAPAAARAPPAPAPQPNPAPATVPGATVFKAGYDLPPWA